MAAVDRTPLSFAALLKRARRSAGLTQEQLAEKAGYSVSYISMLERGERVPARATAELLADALDLTPAERASLAAAAREHGAEARAAEVAAPVPPAPAVPHTSGGPAAPPLAGRVAELALIQRHLAGDGPPLLLFTGEPGLGKTRLLAEARARAEASGWAVLSDAAQRRSAQMPYAPLLEALARHATQQPFARLRAALQGCGWLARLLPELVESGALPAPPWSLPPEQERRLVFAAVARYLANVAGPAGTLLVLDDLQWAGPDALDLLTALLRFGAPARLRVVGAFRDADVAPQNPLALLLADLAPAGLVELRALAPLDEHAATQLAAVLLEGAADRDALVDRAVRRTGGVPFFLVSYAQRLRSGESGRDDVPWDVTQIIRQRVAALPESAAEALAAAALAGRSAPRALVLGVLTAGGHLQEAAEEAVDAACRARLLVEGEPGVFQFAHELTRQVVAADVGAARRASLHRRLGETLERLPGEHPPESLAYHFIRAGEPARARPYLEQAGDRAAAMRAYAAAEGYYAELVQALERLGRLRDAARAREKLAAAQATAAHYPEAIATLDAARAAYHEAGDAEGEGRVMAQLGLAYAASGDAPAGIARLAPFVAAVEAPALPAPVLAALHDALAQLDNVAGRYAEQLDATTRAVDYARQSGDDRLLAQAQMRHGNALRMLGRMRESTDVLEDAIRLAEAAGDPANLTYALDNVSVVYLLQGQLEKTSRYVRRAIELAERLGDPIVTGLMVLRRAMNDFALGEWASARTDFERADDLIRGIGSSWVAAYAAAGLGLIRVATGDAERGVASLLEAEALAERSGDLQALRWAATTHGEFDTLRGAACEARDRLDPLRDRPGMRELLVTYLLPVLAWSEAECGGEGDGARARADVEECLARARDERIYLALVDALRVQALLALRDGDARAALPSLEESIALCREMPYPYGEAKALYVAGLALQQSGDTSAARECFESARTLLARLGEGLYAPRVEAALRAL